MRRQSARKAVRAAALTAPMIIVLAACGSSSSGGAAGPPAEAASAATTGATGATGAAGTIAGGTSAAGSTGSATPRCTTADLTVTLPNHTTGSSQHTLDLTFTNHSSTSCRVYGYPGAELRSATGATWDLVRSPLVPLTTIVLAPGAAAHAKLTYLPGDSATNIIFTPTSVVVIPPDERTAATVPWTGGPVIKQDGATHPGTYISALAPGA